MKNWPKNIFSLIIALTFVAVLLVLPDADNEFKKTLNFLTKGDNTAIAFGHYLIQKFVSGSLIVLATVTISIAAHRVYKKHRSE